MLKKYLRTSVFCFGVILGAVSGALHTKLEACCDDDQGAVDAGRLGLIACCDPWIVVTCHEGFQRKVQVQNIIQPPHRHLETYRVYTGQYIGDLPVSEDRTRWVTTYPPAGARSHEEIDKDHLLGFSCHNLLQLIDSSLTFATIGLTIPNRTLNSENALLLSAIVFSGLTNISNTVGVLQGSKRNHLERWTAGLKWVVDVGSTACLIAAATMIIPDHGTSQGDNSTPTAIPLLLTAGAIKGLNQISSIAGCLHTLYRAGKE